MRLCAFTRTFGGKKEMGNIAIRSLLAVLLCHCLIQCTTSAFVEISSATSMFAGQWGRARSLCTVSRLLHSRQTFCRRNAPQTRFSPPRMMAGGKKTGVLFVCLGNICRSPAAEAVFTSVVQKRGLSDNFDIDSCGTGGGSGNWYKQGGFSFHEGDPADARMKQTASKRGISITSRSRPLQPEDFDRFDSIVYMDTSNRMAIQEAAAYWGINDDKVKDKLKPMMSFARKSNVQYVPDPYYGGSDGFENVLDLLDDACQGLLDSLSP